MAWHSKWHNIKHKKALQDSKKAKVYTKIWKIVQMAAKWWAEPSLNPALASALDKARYYNLPKDVIQRAILKWSGQLEWENLEEIFYEWYWPWWIALLIKTVTSNKNRTWWDVRATITKYWWALWEPWSVAWQFKEKSFFIIEWKVEKFNEKWNEIEKINLVSLDEIEEDAIMAWAESIDNLEWEFKIIWGKEDFLKIKEYLNTKSYKISDYWIEYLPENLIDIDEKIANKLENLIDALNDNDDVDEIFHNAN